MKIWSRPKAQDFSQSVLVHSTPDEDMPLQERWIGFIDRIERRTIEGWCADRKNPDAGVAVEAVGSKGSHAVAIASLFRRDVMESGFGSGNHGFEIDVVDFEDDENVTIRFVENGREITQSPIALDPFSALLARSLPDAFVDAVQTLVRRIEVRHLRLERAEGDGSSRNTDPYDEHLLAPFDPVRDVDGLVTRFTAQEASRIVRDGFDLDRIGSFQDRLGVLFWYVDAYAAARPTSARVPLSVGQIAALNAPARFAGASDAVTVALFNFVLAHKPTHVELRDERLLREAVFWWCTQQTVLHRLDDRLVTKEQVMLLASVEQGTGSQFPCTTFMTLYAREHPEMAELDLGNPRDRLALLGYLVLASFVEPGLLRFLPSEALRKISRATGDGSLGSILGRLAATGDADRGAAGANILSKGEALLVAATGRPLGQRPPINPAALPLPSGRSPAAQSGVRVIGPLAKSSGLGRAMRLSLDVLASCEDEAPEALNFSMEDPASQLVGRRHRGVATRTPRDITLLHLNAEALPLALAYGPRHLLAGTYRIGFFFWELTEIPECHRLALDLVDEIWVASEFNREVYARATSKPVIRVGMAAPSLPAGAPAPRGDWGIEPDVFAFVAVFDSLSFIARKNPLGLIEAFARAFPIGDEPVALVLKTQNRAIVQDEWQVRNWRAVDRGIAADPRIILVDETLPFPDLLALMRACDAYVSLHRSEGWGFGIVEAMQIGLPVVCTGWSGNADFCTAETAFLVPHRLIPAGAGEYIYTPRGSLWADPSIDAAAAQMKIVADDRAAAASKAATARAFVEKELSIETIARRYADRLAIIRTRLKK